MADDPNTPSLAYFPDEVLLIILEKLETNELLHILHVSQRFRYLITTNKSVWSNIHVSIDYNEVSLEEVEAMLRVKFLDFGCMTISNITNGLQVQNLIENVAAHALNLKTIIFESCTFQFTELNNLLMVLTNIKKLAFSATMIHPYVAVEGGDALIVPVFEKLKIVQFRNYLDNSSLIYPHAIFGAMTSLDHIDAVRMENFQLVVQQQNLKGLYIFMSRDTHDFWSPDIQQAITFQLRLFHYVRNYTTNFPPEPELLVFLRSQRALRDLRLCSCGIEEINAVLSHPFLTTFSVVLPAGTTGEMSGINHSVKELVIFFSDSLISETVEKVANAFKGVTTMELAFANTMRNIPKHCQALRFAELKSIVDFSLARIPTSLLKMFEVEMLTQAQIVPSDTYQDRKDVQSFIKFHKKMEVVELDVQLEEEDFQLMLQEWKKLKKLELNWDSISKASAFNLGYVERICKIAKIHGANIESFKLRNIPTEYQHLVQEFFGNDFMVQHKLWEWNDIMRASIFNNE